MKLYAAIQAPKNEKQVHSLISLTKKLPKGDNVFTLYMDDGLTGNKRKFEARKQLTQMIGQRVSTDFYGK
tara:strand:- start:209 stop:418 length:210 start_codon:yes stop_codon:yes gene_type:complete